VMTYIPCPGGLATNWKTKKEALKWLKKVNHWPCGGESHCRGEAACARGGSLFRVKLVKGGYAWNAQVFCICPPLGPPEGEDAIVVWAPVGGSKKLAKKAAKKSAPAK